MSDNLQIDALDQALELLAKNPGFDNAYLAVGELVKLLDNSFNADFSHYKAFTNEKVSARTGWFKDAPGTVGTSTTLELLIDPELDLEIKLFWIKRTAKSVINGSVAFTPNFEDNPNIYPDKKIGIDIFIPATSDRLIVTVSSKLSTRVLELHERVTPTSFEVLKKWQQKFSSKEQLHAILWDSFNLSELNKKFYLQIASYFTSAVSTLTLNGIDEERAKIFTSRLIGRLMFCWFIKKADNIIDNPDQYFTPRGNATEYYHTSLRKLFFGVFNTPISDRHEVMQKHQQSLSLDISGEQSKLFTADVVTPYLNGGLFEEGDLDISEEVVFTNNFFNDFYDFLSEYNFTTDESTSDFEQIAVDPEMLGRIFENLLAEHNPETEKAANTRSAKGAFYTRREIVDYMCKQSLQVYMETYLAKQNIPKIDINKIINSIITLPDAAFATNSSNERTHNLAPYRGAIIDALDNIKVLDPACGSGAFPMGMLQLLMQCYERTFSEAKFNAYDTKKSIIQNSLYGVDIEPMAVEISRLRTWLSLLVEEIADGSISDTLPNLDFKFATANSLIPLKPIKMDGKTVYQSTLLEATSDDPRDMLKQDRKEYYTPENQDKEALKTKIINQINRLKSEYEKDLGHGLSGLLSTYKPFDHNESSGFFDSDFMFDLPDGFDIVIGNPPYVSTKGTNETQKKDLVKAFGFSDDLYSHFYFKGLELCKPGGVLSYITSKTFWTIQTKKNIRELLLSQNLIAIYDTDNPFESVMVDTCVILAQKDALQTGEIRFLKASGDYLNPVELTVPKEIYEKAVNQVIFYPSKYNLQIYDKYNAKVRSIMEYNWDMISTSKNITKHSQKLSSYRKTVLEGNVSLLGLFTDGGVGLQTGNNGNFIGVLNTTKEADKMSASRVDKLYIFCSKKKIQSYGTSRQSVANYLSKLNEKDIRSLFDELKIKYGRDIFGQGFSYRIVEPKEVKNVNEMTDDEKKFGLSGMQTFVPYDKGDKDGNRWYLRTPYYIDWSKENVTFLKKNSGKKNGGMPVVRNPQFYFREGFCWTDVNSTYLKCRLNNCSVFDVLSMSMFTLSPLISDKFAVSLINSKFISEYVSDFVNSTSHFQINDARQIPIIIPTPAQLADFENIFDRAYTIKNNQFDGILTDEAAKEKLKLIQDELDKKVYKLYEINPS